MNAANSLSRHKLTSRFTSIVRIAYIENCYKPYIGWVEYWMLYTMYQLKTHKGFVHTIMNRYALILILHILPISVSNEILSLRVMFCVHYIAMDHKWVVRVWHSVVLWSKKNSSSKAIYLAYLKLFGFVSITGLYNRTYFSTLCANTSQTVLP